MKSIPHKSRTRYLAHNPTGELFRVLSHQFTTADKKNRISLDSVCQAIKEKIG